MNIYGVYHVGGYGDSDLWVSKKGAQWQAEEAAKEAYGYAQEIGEEPDGVPGYEWHALDENTWALWLVRPPRQENGIPHSLTIKEVTAYYVKKIKANECSTCQVCGSCGAGLAMSCTCGPCVCDERCMAPRCEA